MINEYLNSQAKFEKLELGMNLGDKAFKVDWFHITPYSPWKGGVYERMVAIVKRSLKKSLGSRVLDFRSLEALLLGIEDIVNHRPITKSSDHPKDRLALRPIDFIRPSVPHIFIPPTSPDDPDYAVSGIDTAASAKSYLDAVSKRVEDFWEQWRTLYLTQLREKNRASQIASGSKKSPKAGEVVICVDEDLPRDRWKLAVVLKPVLSEDGEIRTVIVRNHNGREISKSVNHLISLEISSSEDPNKKEEDVPEPAISSRPKRTIRKVDYCENSKKRKD